MISAHLLAAVLFVCSAVVFAQQPTDSLAGPAQAAEASKSGEVAPSKPWRLLPNHELNPEWLQNPPKYETAQDQNVIQYFIPDFRTHTIVTLPDGEILAKNTCYTIRSYVVARDEKDSDSTHPVRSSTCQPATRYHMKNAHPGQDFIDR